MAANKAAAAEFLAAEKLFTRAMQRKDRTMLFQQAQPAFERIALAKGRYAAPARDYVSTKIPAAYRKLWRCPKLAVTPATASLLSQSYKEGELVPPGLLDAPPEWTSCPQPHYPFTAKQAGLTMGLAMIQVIVDEKGSVTEVKSRPGQDADGFYNSAAERVRQWKATPPRWKGKAVKTSLTVDILFP